VSASGSAQNPDAVRNAAVNAVWSGTVGTYGARAYRSFRCLQPGDIQRRRRPAVNPVRCQSARTDLTDTHGEGDTDVQLVLLQRNDHVRLSLCCADGGSKRYITCAQTRRDRHVELIKSLFGQTSERRRDGFTAD